MHQSSPRVTPRKFHSVEALVSSPPHSGTLAMPMLKTFTWRISKFLPKHSFLTSWLSLTGIKYINCCLYSQHSTRTTNNCKLNCKQIENFWAGEQQDTFTVVIFEKVNEKPKKAQSKSFYDLVKAFFIKQTNHNHNINHLLTAVFYTKVNFVI